jgi:hypothetical protein
MRLKAIDIAESIMQRRSKKRNLKVLRTNCARRGLAFFGTPHQAPSHRSPGVIETVFSLVSPRIPIRSPYSPELPIVQGFRDQVEDYQFISFYGDSDEVSFAPQRKVSSLTYLGGPIFFCCHEPSRQ